MMISEEQVRRAVEYLRTSDGYWETVVADPHDLPEGLLQRVTALLEAMPDVRDDRVEEARGFLNEPLPNAEELAAKVIGRIVSDSIR
jgi:hypothetical protein